MFSGKIYQKTKDIKEMYEETSTSLHVLEGYALGEGLGRSWTMSQGGWREGSEVV